jgi:hypothetical protein
MTRSCVYPYTETASLLSAAHGPSNRSTGGRDGILQRCAKFFFDGGKRGLRPPPPTLVSGARDFALARR